MGSGLSTWRKETTCRILWTYFLLCTPHPPHGGISSISTLFWWLLHFYLQPRCFTWGLNYYLLTAYLTCMSHWHLKFNRSQADVLTHPSTHQLLLSWCLPSGEPYPRGWYSIHPTVQTKGCPWLLPPTALFDQALVVLLLKSLKFICLHPSLLPLT